jgi:hypothetical protein
VKSGCYASYRVYGAPQPLQAAPLLPCHTRFVPQPSHMSSLFRVAPQFWHEYLRLPPLAVFSIRSPHSGHAFWSCLMGIILRSMSAMAIFQQLVGWSIITTWELSSSLLRSASAVRVRIAMPFGRSNFENLTRYLVER